MDLEGETAASSDGLFRKLKLFSGTKSAPKATNSSIVLFCSRSSLPHFISIGEETGVWFML